MAVIAPKRRFATPRLLAIVLSVALTAAGNGTAASAETIRVGKSSDISFTFIPADVGLQQKIFAKDGVDVAVTDFGGTAKLHQAMIAGAVDIGLGAGTDIPLLMKGAPEIGVGAIALTPALFGITLPYNSPVHSLADLKEKKISVSTVGSLTEWIALQIVKKEGWQRSDITLVDIATAPAEIAALRTGEIDALVSAAALGIDLEQRKEGKLLMPASEFIGPFLMNVIYATKDVTEKHPDAVRGFLKGWYEAVDFMVTHKTETDAIAQTVTHFSATVQDKQYDQVMPSMSRDGTFPREAVEPVAQSFIDLGLLPEKPDMMKYLTTKYLPSH